jgi:molecular chaperone GrpE
MDIDELKKQCEEYLTGWKRAKADLINLQKDTDKERDEWAKYASARTLQRLLPALDALYAAVPHAPDLADTVKKFEEFLKGENVIEINCVGKFDPMFHEVIHMEKGEGAEHGSIMSVAQRGYVMHERVLRPAKVIVAE